VALSAPAAFSRELPAFARLCFPPIAPRRMNVFKSARPHMRAFHCAWVSFFLAFNGWFSIAALMPMVRVSLGLCTNGGWDVLTSARECVCDAACKSAVGTSNMVSVAGTVLMRFAAGGFAEYYGPRVTQLGIMVVFAIPLALAGASTNMAGLTTARFFIGMMGATFVTTQLWTAENI
jgi:NNP family nitrate/nitrite transporter-like MFS transporter